MSSGDSLMKALTYLAIVLMLWSIRYAICDLVRAVSALGVLP